MQQTIQFDTDKDPVLGVLDSVARAYGFAYAYAVHDKEKPTETAAPKPPLPTLPEPVARAPKIAWVKPSAQASTNNGGWNEKRARAFLNEVTRSVQRVIAMLVVEGEVPFEAICQYLNIPSLQGMFSTVGAAQRNVRGLGDVPPYRKARTPTPRYIMDEPIRQFFMDAFINIGNDRFLEDAEAFFKTMAGER